MSDELATRNDLAPVPPAAALEGAYEEPCERCGEFHGQSVGSTCGLLYWTLNSYEQYAQPMPYPEGDALAIDGVLAIVGTASWGSIDGDADLSHVPLALPEGED